MHTHQVFAALCCIATATAALSGEIDTSGTGKGKSMTTPHEIAENHILMELRTDYSDFTFDSADHPMAGMSGPCFGAVEINAGAVSGGGKCLYTDAAGDMVTMDWIAGEMNADGAMTGSWSVSGGTGKWMEAKGGGMFSSLTDPETGENANSVTGAVTMP